MGKFSWQIQITTDETTMLVALTRAYRNSLIEVLTATSASQALAQLANGDFQLMLIDLDMRRQEGFDLLRDVSRLRAGIPLLLHRVGTDLELALTSPEWGLSLRWQARPRELAAIPEPGDTIRLRVPDDAWTVLEVEG